MKRLNKSIIFWHRHQSLTYLFNLTPSKNFPGKFQMLFTSYFLLTSSLLNPHASLLQACNNWGHWRRCPHSANPHLFFPKLLIFREYLKPSFLFLSQKNKKGRKIRMTRTLGTLDFNMGHVTISPLPGKR